MDVSARLLCPEKEKLMAADIMHACMHACKESIQFRDWRRVGPEWAE
jgi:hypothetical protein